MNLVAGTEDVLTHFWVPVTSLVTEVYACFQQVTHANLCHCLTTLYVGVMPPRTLSPDLSKQAPRHISFSPCVSFKYLRTTTL